MQTTSSYSLALLKIVSYENSIAVLSGYLPSSTGTVHCPHKLIQISWAGLCFCIPTIFTHKYWDQYEKSEKHIISKHTTLGPLQKKRIEEFETGQEALFLFSLTLTTVEVSAQKGGGHISKNKDSAPADETYLRERNNLMGHFEDTYHEITCSALFILFNYL